MKRGWLWLTVAVLGVTGIAIFTMFFQPSRMTYAQMKQQAEVERKLAQAGETATPAEAAPAETDKGKETTVEWPKEAPAKFRLNFECSNGTFVLECEKDWAPLGVQRFYELARDGFYTDARFFRVVPGFVVQFGMPADPAVGAKWEGSEMKDDPVRNTNNPGTVSFASRGPNTRTTQVFINLGYNDRLDQMNFAPFGKIVEGMDVVKAINAEYGERPDQGQIRSRGNAYLTASFPRLDYIKKITLAPVEEKKSESPQGDAGAPKAQ